MKALHLDLAARPFRNYRPVWIAVGVMSLITAILMINNGRTAYRFFVNTQDTRTEIAEIEGKIASENERAGRLEDRVQMLDTKRLQGQVLFINSQIAERAFSWSRLLDDLERVFPNDVRLVTLNPSVEPDGPITLNVSCIAKTNSGLVDIIRSMNDDSDFASPFPTSENLLTDGTYSFQLSVDYEPVDELRSTQEPTPEETEE